jgi:RNA polymerase sigma-70 factor (ECF subfamily)
MRPDANLEGLMAGYQQGDADCAADLIDRVSPILHRYFTVKVASRRYADDLLRETWQRIHQGRHTYRPGEPVLPWLYAIARHVCAEQEQRAADPLDPPAAAGDEGEEQAPSLPVILRKLSESQREVVVMHKVSGMSLEDVARATRSNVASVQEEAQTAYDTLRLLLEESSGVKDRK